MSPVRKIVTRSPKRTVGAIPFPTFDTSSEGESKLELSAFLLLSYCVDVAGIEHQPMKISYGDNASATPDGKIRLNDGPSVLVEVKPALIALKEEETTRLASIKAHFASEQMRYDILTEQVLCVQPRFATCRLLRQYQVLTPNHPQILLAKNLLKECHHLPINIWAERSGGALSEALIFSMIGQRSLAIDWLAPLNRFSTVALPDTLFRRMTYDSIVIEDKTNRFLSSVAMGHRSETERRMAIKAARRRPISSDNPWGIG